MTIKHGTGAKDSVRKIQSCKLVATWMGSTYGVGASWSGTVFE